MAEAMVRGRGGGRQRGRATLTRNTRRAGCQAADRHASAVLLSRRRAQGPNRLFLFLNGLQASQRKHVNQRGLCNQQACHAIDDERASFGLRVAYLQVSLS